MVEGTKGMMCSVAVNKLGVSRPWVICINQSTEPHSKERCYSARGKQRDKSKQKLKWDNNIAALHINIMKRMEENNEPVACTEFQYDSSSQYPVLIRGSG